MKEIFFMSQRKNKFGFGGQTSDLTHIRNRQDGIRRTFGDEGRGILVTLKKNLENLKASEDGVNPKNSIV